MPRRRSGKIRRRRSRGTAVKALRLARRAWNATDHETKFIDIPFFQGIVRPSDALFEVVNALAEGAGQDQRIGEKVKLTSVSFRLCLTKNPMAVGPVQSVRFMLVWDKQNNGGLATVAQVLEDVATGNDLLDLQSHRNFQTKPRFAILMDRFVTLNDGFSAGVHRMYNKRLNKSVQYNGAGATIANINTGALIFVFMSEEPLAGGFPPTLTAQVRLRWVG